MPVVLVRIALALAFLGLPAGCATVENLDLLGARDALEEAQRQYTHMVRWGELERAAVFVADDARDAFEATMPRLRGVRITDYQTGELDVDETKQHATVDVVYHGYGTTSLVEVRGREVQAWERDPLTKRWRVRPDLSGMKALLASVPDVSAEP